MGGVGWGGVGLEDIDGFTPEDFELVGYNPLGKIAMEMAV